MVRIKINRIAISIAYRVMVTVRVIVRVPVCRTSIALLRANTARLLGKTLRGMSGASRRCARSASTDLCMLRKVPVGFRIQKE